MNVNARLVCVKTEFFGGPFSLPTGVMVRHLDILSNAAKTVKCFNVLKLEQPCLF